MSAAMVEDGAPPTPSPTQDVSQLFAADEKEPMTPALDAPSGMSTPVLKSEPPESTPELSASASSMTLDSASPTPSSTTLKAASRASSKASATPPPQAQPKKGKKATPNPPQFIGHLPVAREDALRTFRQIPENWYQYAKLGKSREAMEGSTCDCEYEEGDNLDHACGPRSNCINRLTQVECLEEECHCRQFCQNQRFQRKEYAPIEIVKTEKKGFGLRAEQDIQRDTFIYEYVGDVVNSPSFKKRMRDYAKEGIQHFYFMMLQKDEFIDATKSGGIGRFANHSCSPNCYVAKWTVGDRVRMGIFAKRNIKKYEELTFNYNVDRYGHQAQTCYCGEPNCVGYIGGKTQTDVAVIDDVYLEALGITDADELMELKGSKKKKGKKIDDPDFMPKMKPIKREEVPKVVQALRQVQSAKVLYKILLRLKTTEDASALREFMRLRGFSVMRMILDEFAKDMTIVAMALECMTTWPLEKRNKVEDSKITDPVKKYAEMEDETVKNVATKLLETWDKLEIAYRIPRLARDPSQKRKSDLAEVVTLPHEDPRPKRVRYNIPEDEEFVDFKATLRPPIQHTAPPPSPPKPRAPSPPPRKVSYLNLADEKKKLLERAQQLAAEQARAHEERAKADRESKERAERKQREKESRRAARKAEKAKAREERKAREREKKKHQTPEEKEAGKEKRLLKLVGEVVVKSMSKYAKGLPRDVFKKQAKELTHIIAEKEKKSSSFKEGKLDALSEEKVYKMKKFSRDYIAKVMRKYQEKEKGKASRRPAGDDAASASATPGASTSGTPGASTSSAALDTPDMEMTVEEAMDMEPDADDKDEKDESDSESESDSEDEEKDGEAEAGKPNAEGDATPDVSGNGRSGDGIPDDGKGGRMDVDEEPKSAMDVDGSERSAMPDAAPPDVVMKDGTSDGLSIPSPIGGSSTTQDPRLRSRSVTASA